MEMSVILPLTAGLFLIAILYSSIGHGGASGYLAALAIAGFAPEQLKPMALGLNLFVSCIAFWNFQRAGHFSWRLFWPFAVSSIPASFVGGYLTLPLPIYRYGLGLVLILSAFCLIFRTSSKYDNVSRPSIAISCLVGAIIGLVSGLIGVGGGIFLSPLLILLGWAHAKETSAVSALFILVNSGAGVIGYACKYHGFADIPSWFLIAVSVGGLVGSYLGCCRLPRAAIVSTLSFVLITAGSKMIFV